MSTQEVADKIELTELANKLFMYTDAQQWKRLLSEVFCHEVWFDMGDGQAKNLHATEICEMWRQGFLGLDAVHHQAGHYLINIEQGALIFMVMPLQRTIKKQPQKEIRGYTLVAMI